jgi:hypothetical protein
VATRSPLQKIQDVVVGTVRSAVTHPVDTAGKAVHQVRGTFALGRSVAGAATKSATHRAASAAGSVATRVPGVGSPTVQPSAPVPGPDQPVEASPADVARIVEKKAPAAKKAPARKAPAGKAPATKAASSPGAKLPAKKAPAKKAPAKKTPAKKTAPLSAAEVLEDAATEVTTPVGTTGADVATNPSTTDTDLQQPGTEPLLDPSLTKAVASEADTLSRAADPDKG